MTFIINWYDIIDNMHDHWWIRVIIAQNYYQIFEAFYFI